jgi:hypothetical protein
LSNLFPLGEIIPLFHSFLKDFRSTGEVRAVDDEALKGVAFEEKRSLI